MGKQKRGPAKLPQGETVLSLKSKKGDKAAARQLLLWSLPLNACLDYPFWSLVHYLQSTDLSEFDEQTNRQKRHGKYMHGKYIYIHYIYTQYVISPGTPAKNQSKKIRPTVFHPLPPPAPKKPLKFWGYFFLEKTPSWLHSRHRQLLNLFLNDNLHAAGAPHGTTKLGAGFFELPFRVEIFSKPKEPSNRRKMQRGWWSL